MYHVNPTVFVDIVVHGPWAFRCLQSSRQEKTVSALITKKKGFVYKVFCVHRIQRYIYMCVHVSLHR